MSGIVSGVNYSLLFSNNTSVSNITTEMLNTIYSNAPASNAVSTGNPITDLKLAQANEATDVAKEAKTPQVARDIAAFQKGVADAKDIQTALKNPNVMKVLLTANNLSKYIQYPALAQKALLSDPSDSNSLVNKLTEPTCSIRQKPSISPRMALRLCKIPRSLPRSRMAMRK